MKPHIKVIQRNGVDIFVTSSMEMKPVKRARYPIVGRNELERSANEFLINRGLANANSLMEISNSCVSNFAGWWTR